MIVYIPVCKEKTRRQRSLPEVINEKLKKRPGGTPYIVGLSLKVGNHGRKSIFLFECFKQRESI